MYVRTSWYNRRVLYDAQISLSLTQCYSSTELIQTSATLMENQLWI